MLFPTLFLFVHRTHDTCFVLLRLAAFIARRLAAPPPPLSGSGAEVGIYIGVMAIGSDRGAKMLSGKREKKERAEGRGQKTASLKAEACAYPISWYLMDD